MDQQKKDMIINTIFSLFQERLPQSSSSWTVQVTIPTNKQAKEKHTLMWELFQEGDFTREMTTEDTDDVFDFDQYWVAIHFRFLGKTFVQNKKLIPLIKLDASPCLEELLRFHVDTIFEEINNGLQS
jgi:hypothetical protein